MSRPVRSGAALVAFVLALLALAPPGPAVAAGTYTVTVDGGGAGFLYKICLKTTTTVNTYPAGGGDRVCSGKKGSTDGSFDLTAEYTEGDTVWMDVEMLVDLSGHSRTKDNVEITGSHSCTLKGALYAGKFQCENVINKTSFTPPVIDPYQVAVDDPNAPVVQLLTLMAWCVSAAAVAGLLLSGMTLASQLRRGALEERTEYTKQIAFVMAACLLATTAGPIVQALGFSQ
ncbi:hypothetical protein ACFFKH_09610 [Micromonospora marina]|uniref:Uncharacterized protein n=1 Tax=Micromonospora marina TaxID=307120 RepID=A0A1C4XBI0_9ACTN|nr:MULTISPECIES: hypothetical protein [Micromonospora]SCF05735.1 hypothetical protein GA0070215_10727 [Micromonospora marina]